MGNFPKAEEFYLKELKIRLNLLGQKHLNVAVTLSTLGDIYEKMENPQKAEEFCLKSLKISQNLFDENQCDGQFYEKSLIFSKNILGETLCDIPMLFKRLGRIYYKMGNILKAEEFYSKTLEACQNFNLKK